MHQTSRDRWTAVFKVVIIAVTLMASLLSPRPTLAEESAVPANFVDEVVTSVLQPTALAFTPDGRMLITTQPGQVRIYANGALIATPALNLASKLCNNFERGLLGVAIDPLFASNNRVYFYYTFNKFNQCPNQSPSSTQNPVNRVSRFTLESNNLINPASEVVIVDNIPSNNGNHNGGDIHFGADDLLYIAIGDSGAKSTNTGSLTHLAGKILRVNPDGTFPTANPYASAAGVRRCGDPAGVPAGSGPCGEVFAYGLRNPFRIAFRPGTNDFYINDVGEITWEEINEGKIGLDYGWCRREGPDAHSTATNCQRPANATLTAPIYYYNHNAGCNAITGGAFVPDGLWPAPYSGAYLFADYGCGKISRLVSGTPNSSADFATSLGGSSATTLRFGPYNATQALYYTSYAGGGQVRRIRHTGTINQPPSAVIAANPKTGTAPLTVDFSGAGSSDPNPGDTLTYSWNFGNGQSANDKPTATISHTYSVQGVYTATLIVRDNKGAASVPASVRIDVGGNTPPSAAILSPTNSDRFTVGQTITLKGSGIDAQEGTLPDSALTWEAKLVHIDDINPGNLHTHPFFPTTSGNNLQFKAPDLEDLYSGQSYVEINLTVRDSTGLSATINRKVEPKRIQLTFTSDPNGLGLTVRDLPITTTRVFTSWVNSKVPVIAETQTVSDTTWNFKSWSNGGAAAQTITTPSQNTIYKASFVASTATCTTSNLLLNPGFELGGIKWRNLGNSSIVPEAPFSGERAARLGAGNGGRRQNVSVQTNKIYALSAWAKLSNVNQKAWLRISVNDRLYQVPITSTIYQRYAITFTTPITFGVWPPHVILWKAADNGAYVFFDELKLNEHCRNPVTGEPIEEVPVNAVLEGDQPAPYQLNDQNAERRSESKVRLTWTLSDTTDIPSDLAGFIVHRSPTDSIEEAEAIMDERMQGDGTTYEFIDTTATADATYTYWLSIITVDGSTTELRLGEVTPYEPALDANQVFLPLVSSE